MSSKASQMPTVDVERFWLEGYAILRGFFTPEEVLAWREAAYQTSRDDWVKLRPDLLSKSELRSIILDDRVLFVANHLLGVTPIYFGDSVCAIGYVGHGFHKDNPDRWDQSAPDWQTPRYPLIRMGIYCQDHRRNPGGLDLRGRSHHSTNVRSGYYVHADTTPGDLVIWTLCTSHSGSGIMLRAPRIHLAPSPLFTRILRRLPKVLQASQPVERMLLSVTFGSESPHLERYIRYLRTRQFAVTCWRNSVYGPEVWEAAQGKPIKIRDMKAELERDPPTDVRKEHHPLRTDRIGHKDQPFHTPMRPHRRRAGLILAIAAFRHQPFKPRLFASWGVLFYCSYPFIFIKSARCEIHTEFFLRMV